MSLSDFLNVFKGERTGGQISRIGVILIGFYQKLLEIGIGYNGFSADDHVSLVGDGGENTAHRRGEMCDVGACMPVSAGDDFLELSAVISDDKGQTVKFPGYPYLSHLCPLGEIRDFLCLCQRERREFVLLLLTLDIVLGDLCRRGVGQNFARLLLELFEPVEF